jgi:pimeloyl-ACP methyl ester carboxylesterase
MKRLLFFTLLALCVPLTAQPKSPAPSIEGTWQGAVEVNGISLRLAFHISRTPKGLSATMDSIDQGAKGIPVSSVSMQGDGVVIDMPNIKGSFKGKLSADAATIDGQWSQPAGRFPLQLKRTANDAVAEARRPQNPVKPFPYGEEDVTFPNPGAAIQLAGTLTRPSGKGPFTSVVLITGSGPQNRDEEVFGHRPFLVLSDYLTRRGIAVLRVDDRGVAKSGGNFAAATTADFATDVESAVAYLKSRAEVDPHRIGLIGHSEGAVIAPMIASRNPDIAFIVMLAGFAVPGSELIPEQVRMLVLAAGKSPAVARQGAAEESALLQLIVTEKDPVQLQKKLEEKLSSIMPEEQVGPAIETLTSPWYRYFLTYDPAPALRQVKCPVLALNGSLDRQVAPEQSRDIRAALQQGGNQHFETLEMPGLNHLFQTARTGGPEEYSVIEETIAPEVLQKVASWIEKNSSPPEKN